ncbi:MAG: DUF262 domain-containing protein [Ruminococcaceae bacterium]|nr:DUF262 domain-containing protein [Oscillospiraceae bacterium]
MSFEAKNNSMGSILNKVIFEIPRNQRRYVWNKDNWQDLYEDIIFSISEEKPHFMGSIVLEETSKKHDLTYYTIIDGQQRISTITFALIAIMKLFFERSMDDAFEGTISYLQSKNNRNQKLNILNSDYHISIGSITSAILTMEDRNISISAFINTHILSKSKDKCIGEAIKYFYSTIKSDIESNDDSNERLISIRDAILDVTVVKIVSSSEEDSYTIFEILNARGQDLEPHELLKNFIMRYIQPIELRDDAKVKWEEMESSVGSTINKYVKHYTTHKFGDIRDKYSSPYHAIQKNYRGKNVAELLEDIKLKSEYYKKIIHPTVGADGNCTQTEYKVFMFFKAKKFEQIRPIILSLIHQKELEKIDNTKYELALKYIYNFFVCYTIIGEEKSNRLEDVVYKHAQLLENEYSEEVLQEFASSLKRKIPGLEWFINAFKNVGWSNYHDLYKGEKCKNRVKIILEVVEKHKSQNDSINEFTIEHMLPDSENIENAQIGNLIPLEEPLNRRCSTKPLSEKYEIYRESNFASARGASARYVGKEFNASQRTEFLAKLIYNNILELNQLDFTIDT